MTNNQTKTDAIPLPLERRSFKALLAQNPNYFGNLLDSPFKPVKTILGNTTYEEISLIELNSDRTALEATIKIKVPYKDEVESCRTESVEYIRFYLDCGSGWQDAGLADVNIHDVPNNQDWLGSAEKPKTYVVSRAIDTIRSVSGPPIQPRVRAILSWNQIPPPDNPIWAPVWGNVVDQAFPSHVSR